MFFAATHLLQHTELMWFQASTAEAAVVTIFHVSLSNQLGGLSKFD